MDVEVKQIDQGTMSKFKNNPTEMLDYIEMNLKNIKRVSNERIFTDHQFALQVFHALLTSTNTKLLMALFPQIYQIVRVPRGNG